LLAIWKRDECDRRGPLSTVGIFVSSFSRISVDPFMFSFF